MVMVCFLLMKLSEYVPLNVQTQCWAWIKLATDNFSTVLTKNLRNTRDYAPLIIVLAYTKPVDSQHQIVPFF